MEGKDLEGTKDELKAKLLPTLYTNWKVWPLLQLINFALVPPQLQVLYVNFMQLWWNVYLSFMKNSSRVAEASNDVDCSRQQIEMSSFISKLKSAKDFENNAFNDEIRQQIAYHKVETFEVNSIPRHFIRHQHIHQMF